MMTVTTIGFHGVLQSHEPTTYTVRCATCGAQVGAGRSRVDLDARHHECPDTTSGTREYVVTFDLTEPEPTDIERGADHVDPSER